MLLVQSERGEFPSGMLVENQTQLVGAHFGEEDEEWGSGCSGEESHLAVRCVRNRVLIHLPHLRRS